MCYVLKNVLLMEGFTAAKKTITTMDGSCLLPMLYRSDKLKFLMPVDNVSETTIQNNYEQ